MTEIVRERKFFYPRETLRDTLIWAKLRSTPPPPAGVPKGVNPAYSSAPLGQ